ncbi:Cytosolic carboxypeptidase 2 [Entophlyctis luteolus]|nr:Cytosolic carboxypeptidase 2 [Entophlyctis luteolus]
MRPRGVVRTIQTVTGATPIAASAPPRPTAATLGTDAVPDLAKFAEALQAREMIQRRLFALGLLVASTMTAFLAYNVDKMHSDFTNYVHDAEERFSILEQQLDALRKAQFHESARKFHSEQLPKPQLRDRTGNVIVRPVTYDPTRNFLDFPEGTGNLREATQLARDKNDIMSSCEQSSSDGNCEDILEQYAEMTGITFSLGFLREIANQSISNHEIRIESDADNSPLQEEELPFHKSRLPKSYKPNIVNPRPISSVDGPASPIWPYFIKDTVSHPDIVHTPQSGKELLGPSFYQSTYTSKTIGEMSGAATNPSVSKVGEICEIPALTFESRFECGNLGTAIRCGPSFYELHVRPDLDTSGHTQWYYFQIGRMITMTRDTGQEVAYRFDIVNLGKPKTLYSSGLRPLMYSKYLMGTAGIGWHRAGENINYSETKSDVRTLDENCPQDSPSQRYTLSFTVNFPCENDVVYLAHCYPFSYTDLQNDIYELKSDPLRCHIFRHTILATSVAGNNIDMLTITAPSTSPMELGQRKGIIVSARVHPGETNSSWMMRGLMRFLTGTSEAAQQLRQSFVLKIIPMINPDGVIIGNFKMQPSKQGTGRISVRKEFGIVNSFTIEASFCGVDSLLSAEDKGWHFGSNDFERMGEQIGYSIYEYFIEEGKRDSLHSKIMDGVVIGDNTFSLEDR